MNGRWLEKHSQTINVLNMIATFILSLVVGFATIAITKTQRDIEYQEVRPSFNVNAEYQETRHRETKDSDYEEPLVGVNEITKVTVSNDGALLYRPEFRVFPFFQIKRMIKQGIQQLPYYEESWESFQEYQEAVKHPQYQLETIYRPVILNVSEQNLNIYRITITGTKKGELCSITDSNITDRIIALFEMIEPIYTLCGNDNGLFWVFKDGEYIEKDRAMMYVSLEYFIEISYSTTLEKQKKETEVYHVVTGHDGYIGTADFGEPVRVSLLTEDDWLYQYYEETKKIRDGGVAIATDYPVDLNPEDFVQYYEMDIDDILHSTNLEMAEKRLSEGW